MDTPIVDLPGLVAPHSEQEFMSCLRRRLPLAGRGDARRYETLLDWPMLNHLIGSSIYPVERLHVLRESAPIPSTFYTKRGRFESRSLSRLLETGVTLVFDGLDEYVPQFRTVCDDISARTRERITAAAVVTSELMTSAELQFADEDAILMQLAGDQRCVIYDRPVPNPVKGMRPARDPNAKPVVDEILREGDFLFVPAGHWHSVMSRTGRSLHATVLFDPPNGRDLVTTLSQAWLEDDIFRRPLTRHATSASMAAHEEMLKRCLVEKVREWSLENYAAEAAAPNAPEQIRLEGIAERSPVAPGQ